MKTNYLKNTVFIQYIKTMRNYFILFALLITNHKSIKAQDARVSDFTAIPLITNPANTGNFDGTIRAIGFYSKMSDLELSNNLFNLNADYKFSKKKLGLGINYMTTGSSNFNMSFNSLGLSAAKYLYLDKTHLQKIMFGLQVAYLSGIYNISKGGYTPYLDVRSFTYAISGLSKDKDTTKFSKQFVNLNLGVGYSLNYEKIKFDLDAAVYNIPHVYNRYRLSTNISFAYLLDNKNVLKFKQLFWQEGFFIQRVSSSRDSVKIKEVFFNLEWQRKEKVLSSFGLQTCGFKSFSAIAGFKLNSSLSSRISYEIPFVKNEYNPSKFGLSMMYIFKGKKYKEEKATGKDLFLNVKHDTIYITKLDTFKIVEKNKEDGTSNNLKNSIEIKTDQKTIDTSANEETLKSKDSLLNDLNKSDYANEGVVYFGINEYMLTPEGKNLVDRFIINKLINIGNRILIKGYCDDLGSESWNKVLSKLRAQKVKEYLISKGFKSADISVMSFGKSKFPIPDSEKSKFRKAVILLIH